MLRLVRRLLISTLLLMPLAGISQEAAPQPSEQPTQHSTEQPAEQPAVQPRAQVFAGYVTEFNPILISVSRKNASGKEMVHKSFTMDGHTRVEGKIKLNARVTVQYMADGDSNHAVRIIVRGS